MTQSLIVLTLLAGSIVFPPETMTRQVYPTTHLIEEAQRTPDQFRAVIIIHGLGVHPFNKHHVDRAALHQCQKPNCLLVKQLGKEADVYAFAYSQEVAVEEIAIQPGLPRCVQHLQELGYREIVLVGYSAGGLIARHFVEDNPNAPVTKVIQVCPPNAGSSWAEFRAVLPNQSKFLYSLTKEARSIQLHLRADKKIPDRIQFACIVGTGAGKGDGLVLCSSAWTTDLQVQGIPVYPVNCTHWLVPRTHQGVDLIAELVRQPQPRWPGKRVIAARKILLRD